jgi:hypothetical protein
MEYLLNEPLQFHATQGVKSLGQQQKQKRSGRHQQ